MSLQAALRHGYARYYKPDVPWRIYAGKAQLGIPSALSPLQYSWEEVTREQISKWPQGGWILVGA